MKTYILIYLFLTTPIFAAYASNPVPQQRTSADVWYAQQVAAIRIQALEFAQQTPIEDRILWAEFSNTFTGSSFPDTWFYVPTANWPLRQSMVDYTFLTTMTNFFMDERAFALISEIAYSDTYYPLPMRQYAQKLLPKVDFFHAQLMQLQRARQAKLLQLQSFIQNSAAPQTISAPGTVNAISYGTRNSFAAIEGVENMVRPGQLINTAQIKNVKVLKIMRMAVVLQKDGHAWTQPIDTPPDPAWTSN